MLGSGKQKPTIKDAEVSRLVVLAENNISPYKYRLTKERPPYSKKPEDDRLTKQFYDDSADETTCDATSKRIASYSPLNFIHRDKSFDKLTKNSFVAEPKCGCAESESQSNAFRRSRSSTDFAVPKADIVMKNEEKYSSGYRHKKKLLTLPILRRRLPSPESCEDDPLSTKIDHMHLDHSQSRCRNTYLGNSGPHLPPYHPINCSYIDVNDNILRLPASAIGDRKYLPCGKESLDDPQRKASISNDLCSKSCLSCFMGSCGLHNNVRQGKETFLSRPLRCMGRQKLLFAFQKPTHAMMEKPHEAYSTEKPRNIPFFSQSVASVNNRTMTQCRTASLDVHPEGTYPLSVSHRYNRHFCHEAIAPLWVSVRCGNAGEHTFGYQAFPHLLFEGITPRLMCVKFDNMRDMLLLKLIHLIKERSEIARVPEEDDPRNIQDRSVAYTHEKRNHLQKGTGRSDAFVGGQKGHKDTHGVKTRYLASCHDRLKRKAFDTDQPFRDSLRKEEKMLRNSVPRTPSPVTTKSSEFPARSLTPKSKIRSILLSKRWTKYNNNIEEKKEIKAQQHHPKMFQRKGLKKKSNLVAKMDSFGNVLRGSSVELNSRYKSSLVHLRTIHQLLSNKSRGKKWKKRITRCFAQIYKICPIFVVLLYLLLKVHDRKTQGTEPADASVGAMSLRKLYFLLFVNHATPELVLILRCIYQELSHAECEGRTSTYVNDDIERLTTKERRRDVQGSGEAYAVWLWVALLGLWLHGLDHDISFKSVNSILLPTGSRQRKGTQGESYKNGIYPMENNKIKMNKDSEPLRPDYPQDRIVRMQGVQETMQRNPRTVQCVDNIENVFALGPVLGIGGEGQVRMCIPLQVVNQKGWDVENLDWDYIWRMSREALLQDAEPFLFSMKITFRQHGENSIQKLYTQLETLNHPNVLRMRGLYQDDENYFLLTDILEGPELLSYFLSISSKRRVKKKKTLPEHKCKGIFRQVLKAIEYLHSRQLIHCDVKLENLVCADLSKMSDFIHHDSPCSEDMYTDDCTDVPRIVLIDFGLACSTAQARYTRPNGTPLYMAPEMLLAEPLPPYEYMEHVDVWACGVILYQLLLGEVPFDSAGVLSQMSKIGTVECDESGLFPRDAQYNSADTISITRCSESPRYFEQQTVSTESIEDASTQPFPMNTRGTASSPHIAPECLSGRRKVLDLYRMRCFFPEAEEWTMISEKAKDLIQGLLTPNINCRLTACQALNHSWFRG